MLSTVASAKNEAELKRQRERQKSKERKSKRRSGNRKEAAAAPQTTTVEDEPTEDFIAFSKFASDDAQAEMDDIERHQQEIVDADAAEAAEAAQVEAEEAAQQQAQDEDEAEADAEMQTEDAEEEVEAEVEEEESPAAEVEVEADGEEEEEELLPSSDDEASEAAEDDPAAVDVVDPNVSDEDTNEAADDDAAPADSPVASPSASTSLNTPTTGARSKKRTSSHADSLSAAAAALPSVRLSTFAFKRDQVEFDAKRREYILRFRAGDTLAFHGSVAFSVEEGYIDVHGHTFNPRSKRQRFGTDENGVATATATTQFTAHSWQWLPHALLCLTAKASGSFGDEFVAIVRVRACASRFAPQRLAAWTAQDVPDAEAGPPTIIHDPYANTPAPSADGDTDVAAPAVTPTKTTPAAKRQNKRQKKNDAAEPSDATAEPGFVRLHIPGFTPVLFSDDDFRAAAAAESIAAAAGVDAAPVPSQRFVYGLLSIPSEWESSVQQMLLPQVPTAEDNDQLSKSQLLDRKVHLKTLRQQILGAGLRVLVYGSRNAGKSTLLSFLTNQCLNKFQKVLYLDLDVGQSSLNPPGMIALHEVDAPLLSTSTHPMTARGVVGSRMVWSYFVGDATQTHDPSSVMRATAEAVRIYETKYGPTSKSTSLCPLVVNTQGWITGLGLELLQRTVRDIVRPVYLIEVRVDKAEDASQSARKKQRAGDEEEDETVIGEIAHPHQLYIFRRTADAATTASMLTSSSIATAQRLRQLQLLSYFTAGSRANSLSVALPTTLSSFASHLCALHPYRVPFARVALEVIGMDAGRDFESASILAVLNASIVGLCVRGTSDTRGELIAKKTGLRLLAARPPTEPFEADEPRQAIDVCLGQGIVRGIDLAARCFYLLTPLPAAQLQRVNLLQKGKLELPNMAFGVDSHGAARIATRDQGQPEQPVSLPYLSTTTLSAGSGLGSREMSSRNNIQRKRLN